MARRLTTQMRIRALPLARAVHITETQANAHRMDKVDKSLRVVLTDSGLLIRSELQATSSQDGKRAAWVVSLILDSLTASLTQVVEEGANSNRILREVAGMRHHKVIHLERVLNESAGVNMV